MDVQAIAYRFGSPVAAWRKIANAIEASFVPAIRKLCTAVVMETDIARIATIQIIRGEVDTFAIRSPASPTGTVRRTCWILAACREEESDGRGEQGKSDQKWAHGIP